MYAIDFEYDGILASDCNLMICSFDSKGVETVDCGSSITFNTVPLLNGTRYALTNTLYENDTEYTFQICKSSCLTKLTPFDIDEQRKVFRWLNRNDGFHKLKIIQDGYEDIFFEGSFNVKTIQISGEVHGFELTFITNRPFALMEAEKYIINADSNDYVFCFEDISDNIGYIYPRIQIKCNANGDLKIHNAIEDRTTIIKNCNIGELITCDEFLNISTSLPSHKLYDDFNFVFLRIANRFDESKNTLTISIPCEIKIEYNPIVKGVGM